MNLLGIACFATIPTSLLLFVRRFLLCPIQGSKLVPHRTTQNFTNCRSGYLHRVLELELSVVQGVARERPRRSYATTLIILQSIGDALRLLLFFSIEIDLLRRSVLATLSTESNSTSNAEMTLANASTGDKSERTTYGRGLRVSRVLSVVGAFSRCVLSTTGGRGSSNKGTKGYEVVLPPLIAVLQSKQLSAFEDSLCGLRVTGRRPGK